MTAEQYLERVKKIDALIENKLKDYKRWVVAAEGLGGFSVSERVRSSGNLQKMPGAIANYIEIEQEIEALKQERRAIIKTLERLPPTEYKLLHKSFIQELTLYEIADYFGKSYDWAKKKKRAALDMLQEIIDEL